MMSLYREVVLGAGYDTLLKVVRPTVTLHSSPRPNSQQSSFTCIGSGLFLWQDISLITTKGGFEPLESILSYFLV
jgi:hypothetical protein